MDILLAFQRKIEEAERMRIEISRLRAEVKTARRDALREAAEIARWSHMVPPDGGSPTEEEFRVAKEAADQIEALAAREG